MIIKKLFKFILQLPELKKHSYAFQKLHEFYFIFTTSPKLFKIDIRNSQITHLNFVIIHKVLINEL